MYLRDVVLRGMCRVERHGGHGHDDGLVGGVDGRGGGLRAGPDGRCVGWDGGSRRLHLSPLEKLGGGGHAKRESDLRELPSLQGESAPESKLPV